MGPRQGYIFVPPSFFRVNVCGASPQYQRPSTDIFECGGFLEWILKFTIEKFLFIWVFEVILKVILSWFISFFFSIFLYNSQGYYLICRTYSSVRRVSANSIEEQYTNILPVSRYVVQSNSKYCILTLFIHDWLTPAYPDEHFSAVILLHSVQFVVYVGIISHQPPK